MPSPLPSFHYHVADDAELDDSATARTPQSLGELAEASAEDGPPVEFTSDEAAARYFLDALLRRDDRAAMSAVVEPERPERVPGLVMEQQRDLRALGTHQLQFTQTHQAIPVFGSRAVVELTGSRDLVSVNAQLDAVSGVDPVESLSRAEAVARVASYTGVELPAEAAAVGRLNFYKDDEGAWHLAWLFRGLPARPPATAATAAPDEGPVDHGMGPRPGPPRYTYLVDAHDGEILFHYSAIPTALPTPARCTGLDEDDEQHTFWGRLAGASGTTCQLADPLRRCLTYDLEFADIDSDPPVPDNPVAADTSDFEGSNRAAVSAHVNASRVQDFYRLVLQRDGIDDQGTNLISQVNTTYAQQEPPPALLNAFWWDGRMWYGQIRRDGRLVSLSRWLDVIGHELTHGVIESTSALEYVTQSGALNESFADAAGVIISNWYTAADPEDVDTWNWEIGPGLLTGGRPLRDFADPTRRNQPAHMDGFRALRPGEQPSDANDNGWVHHNSGIPNKAVHHLLTMSRNGSRIFTVTDVALLTYLGMARLTPFATFSQTRQSLVDVAQTYFGGSADKKDKIDAIKEAYELVGII